MTQGILDYLLIRSMLMLYDKNSLIEYTNDDESFNHFIKVIVDIMINENYILTSDEIIKKLDDIIYHYRFQYLKNNEVNDRINFIINKLNQYKNMSYSERKLLTNQWLYNERVARGLPESCERFEYIYGLIHFDKEFILLLYGLLGEELELHEEYEYVIWLSLINLAINRFPEDFKNFNQETIMSQLSYFKKIKGFSPVTKKILKTTSLNLKKFNKEYKVKYKKLKLL